VSGNRSIDTFWQDKTVIITGGSSGIGAALGQHVANRGARVGLIARRAKALEEVAANIHEVGGHVRFAIADVCDADALRSAIKQLEAELGRTDILIANAGTHRYTPGASFKADDFALVHATNVQGAANAFDAVLPGMIERQSGHLAAVASIAGMVGLPGVAAYSSSKAALITMMQSLRADLHSYGIRVTALCPGFVDTPFIANHDRRVLKFLLSPEQAAAIMAKAIAHGKARKHFPWPTWLTARIASAMPDRIYRWLTRKVPREPLELPRKK
jgi:short-subunit dehydrogenase